MKRLEYHFTRVSAPAPKRLIIESRSDGSHSISDGGDRDHGSVVDEEKVTEAGVSGVLDIAGASNIMVSRLSVV